MDTSIRMIGVSSAMRAVEEEIKYAALSDARVLITGESGVGKEIVARLIHHRSGRGHGPLVSINCAGFPDALLQSELFGHFEGGFGDADRDRTSSMQRAHGGTIFMDEVGELSLRMQALLLRFLEFGEPGRLEVEPRPPRIDARMIAAAHQSLLEQVSAKRFREDLYYRLNVINIPVPPLRERREDILVLLRHFLKLAAESHRAAQAELTPAALKYLTAYDYPGNVRELRNIAERVVARAHGGRVDVGALPREVLAGGGTPYRERVPEGVDPLFRALLARQASFWPDVYERYMARDLNRYEIRALIRLGLEHTRGSYKMLVTAFNMSPEDYRKFLTFLHKHHCHVPYQPFRVMGASTQAAELEHPRTA